jgi:hypothetical protein
MNISPENNEINTQINNNVNTDFIIESCNEQIYPIFNYLAILVNILCIFFIIYLIWKYLINIKLLWINLKNKIYKFLTWIKNKLNSKEIITNLLKKYLIIWIIAALFLWYDITLSATINIFTTTYCDADEDFLNKLNEVKNSTSQSIKFINWIEKQLSEYMDKII